MSIYLGNTLIAGSNGNGVEKSTTNGILKKQVSESHHPIIENNDGTIILKAGSKLYVGGYYKIITIEEDWDISNVGDLPQGTKDYAIIIYNYNSDFYDTVGGVPVEVLGKPPYQYYMNTVCYELYTTGPSYKPMLSSSSWSATLPICIVRTDGTVEPYIKDVYQIGNACLVFKDSLKVSIPNGRNSDGTLNNLIVSSVDSTLTNISGTDKIYIDSTGALQKSSNYEYNQHENHNTVDGSNVLYAKIGDFSSIDDVIQLATKEDLKSVVNYSNISNCITHIPQDIKLEFNNGTLTLKAGSKIYIPNGFEDDMTTPYFDEVVIENDIITNNWGGTYQRIACIKDGALVPMANHFSGASAPTVTGNAYWYDTTNNIIKKTSNSGSTWDSGYSLPIVIGSSTNGVITAVDQVFNGFGYIGSTVFALPGIKGLIPNGRNADGSLKNIEITLNSVRIATRTSSYTGGLYFVIGSSWTALSASNYYHYDEKRNYNGDSNGISFGCICCSVDCSGTTLSNFQPKTSFHAVDYNDSSWIAQQGMPSSKNTTLTPGSSGTIYTAPANGYFFTRVKATTASSSWVTLKNNSSSIVDGLDYSRTSANFYGCVHALKGDTVTLQYGSANVEVVIFIYAEGEQ